MPRAPADPIRAAETQRLRREAGAWLKSLREEAGLTQSELSKRVGLRYYTFISQVESGLGRAPIEVQGLWADAVGLEGDVFARTLLRYYEPELYRLLYPAEARPRAGRPVGRKAG